MSVLRPPRLVTHFEPKSEEALQQIEREDVELGRILRRRQQDRPFGHDVIELKCGHVVVRPRPQKVHLWVQLPCEMCTRREIELAVRSEAGDRRRQQELAARAEATRMGEEEMAKKAATKKVAKVSAVKSSERTRAWKQSYAFLKPLKLEPPKESVKGAVYAGIQSVKTGGVDDVTAAAIKHGLKDYTKQDPRTMTQSLLRQFAEAGSVKIVRDEATPVKTTSTKTAKKKIVLKKKASSSTSTEASA